MFFRCKDLWLGNLNSCLQSFPRRPLSLYCNVQIFFLSVEKDSTMSSRSVALDSRYNCDRVSGSRQVGRRSICARQ